MSGNQLFHLLLGLSTERASGGTRFGSHIRIIHEAGVLTYGKLRPRSPDFPCPPTGTSGICEANAIHSPNQVEDPWPLLVCICQHHGVRVVEYRVCVRDSMCGTDLGCEYRCLAHPVHPCSLPILSDMSHKEEGHESSIGIRQSRATSTGRAEPDQVPSRAASTVSVSERSGRRKSGLRPLSEPSPSLPVPTRRQRTPPALAQRKSLAVSPTIHTSEGE